MLTYLIYALPGIALALYAQFKVKSTFAKYAQVPTQKGVNGVQAAQWIMDHTNVHVRVDRIQGELTDHYDPRGKVIRLSDSSVQNSVASVAVVAHELGHAEQDAQEYLPLKVRGAIVPAVSAGGGIAPMLFMVGIFLNSAGLMLAGAILFSLTTVFALITLPVEFNASTRALRTLESSQLLTAQEMVGAKKVLNAAALTYVAAALQSILILLYYLSASRSNN